MSYSLTPSPLGGTERLLVTKDLRGITLARSLGGRPVRAHDGFFLPSRKAVIWTALYRGEAIATNNNYGWKYKLPGGLRFTTLGIVMTQLREAEAAKAPA